MENGVWVLWFAIRHLPGSAQTKTPASTRRQVPNVKDLQTLVHFCVWSPGTCVFPLIAMVSSTMNTVLVSSLAMFISLLQVIFPDESRRGDLNGSVFLWSLVNGILSLLSPGLIFYESLFSPKTPLVVHSIFLQLIIGNRIQCFCGPLETFLLN